MRDKSGFEGPSVSELLDLRLADLRVTGKARAQNTPSIHKPLHKHFGAACADKITPALVHQYWTIRQHVPASLREELAELKTALRIAKKRGLVDHIPDLELPPKRPPRQLLLTRQEAQALLDAADQPYLRHYLLIAMTTGARRGAIMDLTWDRVDFVRGRIDFRDPTRAITNKRRTIVPVHQTVMNTLSKAKETAQTPYVMEHKGRHLTSIRRAFRRAAERAGVPRTTPHVLKHSVVSWLAEDGYTVDQISDMTATHPNTVRQVYRKVSPNYLSDLAASLGTGIGLQNSTT